MRAHAQRHACRSLPGAVLLASRWLQVAVLLVALGMGPGRAAGQGLEVHGADSVFGGHGVAIAWGVLRGAAEDETQVVIRIALARPAYAHVRLDAVDPFGPARQAIEPGRSLPEPPGTLDVRSPRARFAELPRRELRFYRTAEDWHAGRAALTVYYLGVPDTTPEFTAEPALTAYLDAAIARARPAAGGP